MTQPHMARENAAIPARAGTAAGLRVLGAGVPVASVVDGLALLAARRDDAARTGAPARFPETA